MVVHLDGLKERHDEAVDREGVFDEAVEAIREAKRRGFRVTTNSTFFTNDSPKTVREVLDFLNDDLKVDAMMISPAYAYEKAPDQEHFLGVTPDPARCSPRPSPTGTARSWRLNHTPLFLDFLEGKEEYQCTPWGIPSYSIFGWQRPCYLMGDGYTETYKELLETTDWSKYGRGERPAVRQLHGALRLRADGRARDDEVAEAVAAGGGRHALGGPGTRATAPHGSAPLASGPHAPGPGRTAAVSSPPSSSPVGASADQAKVADQSTSP